MAKITDLDDVVLTFSAGDLGTDADLFIDTTTPAIQMASGFTIDADDGISEQCVYSSLYWFWQYRIKYTFDDAITSGPGAGLLRFDNATLASVTNIYVSQTDGSSSAKDRAKMLAQIADTEIIEVLLADASWDVDLTAKIKFTVNGTPTDNGTDWTIPVTYVSHTGSFTDAALVMLSPASPFAGVDFPIEAISANAGEFAINQTSSKAWNWANDTTRGLIRDGGWQLISSSGVVIEEWMNITSLGALNDAANDQPFFWQVDSTTATTTNTVRTGPVNQAVKIFGGPSNGNFDYRDFFKIAVKEQGDTQVVVDLLSALALSSLSAQKYSFALSTDDDLKITTADTGIDANSDGTADVAPYDAISISWGTASVDVGDGNGAQPFNRAVIDAGDAATWTEIHEWAAWQTRQTGDIDPGAGTRNGVLEDPLTSFVGDRLVTAQGVAIINYVAVDVNNVNSEVTFTDSNGVARSPANPDFIAQFTIQFNAILTDNPNAEYWVYIEETFGTATPILVNNSDGDPVTGLVNGATSVTVSYDWDNNTQNSRTPGDPVNIVVVAIGANGSQWFRTPPSTASITRTTTNNISLNSNLDRNYVDEAA